MYTAAELIAALQRRLRLTLYRTRPGQFPPGWQVWLDQLRDQASQRGVAVTGAPAKAIVDVFLQRALSAPPAAAPALNRWQAFTTLWRQEWKPAEPEERWVRVLSAAVSLLMHLGFALMLLWLAIVQMRLGPPPVGDEVVTQVEYIGVGATDQTGGGPPREPQPPEVPPTEATPEPAVATADSPTPQSNAPAPPAIPAPRIASETPQLQTPVLEVPPLEVVQREVPQPEPPAEQPLTVSKPTPDAGSFVLPPSSLALPQPEVAVPEVRLSTPPLQVQVVDVPAPLQPIQPRRPVEIEIEAPVLVRETPEVVEREIPAPRVLAPVRLPEQPQPVVTAPELRPEIPDVKAVTIPAPAPVAAAVADAPEDPVDAPAAPPRLPASKPPPTAIDSIAAPAPQRSTDSMAGAGPEPATAPGAWSTLKRADDWDDADRARPGAQAGEPPGLFDSDGSVNLADLPGSASPGVAPGTLTEEIADLDRAGTWLRRPSFDYQPSALAQYWRPNESLLEEWVRKSVTTVRIPIPGTNKHIVCQTVLLVVGGSCTVTDPDLNDQPATARPPPDIPFDPKLQQAPGSAGPGG